MKWFQIFLLVSVFFGFDANAQNSFHCIVKDSVTREALIGVSALVEQTTLGAASNLDGELVIRNIPNGQHTIRISYVGYAEKDILLKVPGKKADTVFLIFLSPTESVTRCSTWQKG